MIIEQTYNYFTTENEIYPYEQMLVESDTLRVKFADGETAYLDIEYSGFIWVNNHLEVESNISSVTAYIDTIIDDNEITLRDRVIAGNSIVIQEII